MGVAAPTPPPTMNKSVGSILVRGGQGVLLRSHSALDEGIGPSDLDFLNLTDYQALCVGARTSSPEILVELYAAKDWRVHFA